MKILHYSLGFPPFRTGGMTQYCIDLMNEQSEYGHSVGMLWPGSYSLINKKVKVKKRKPVVQNENSRVIESYEIINPLPVPLLDGIKETDKFMIDCEEVVFTKLFKQESFDAFHVHTLMGLPKACIRAAKNCGVRIVYTSHDYYGLCPNGSFMHGTSLCCDDHDCKDCIDCNKTALSVRKIQILQSGLYRAIKNTSIAKRLRVRHLKMVTKNNITTVESTTIQSNNDDIAAGYRKLRNYYISMYKEIDILHFNSTGTQMVFNRFFDTSKNGRAISITHSAIRNNKCLRNYSEIVNFSYLGSVSVRKGFFLLKSVLDKLYKNGKTNFKLHIYSRFDDESPYIVKHASYQRSELGKVMNQTDMLIVPSLWNETFGFTVLEALSYGVPVLTSNRVGAKDLLMQGKSGLIYNDIGELESLISNILDNPPVLLKKMNDYIYKNTEIKDIRLHANEILSLYK